MHADRTVMIDTAKAEALVSGFCERTGFEVKPVYSASEVCSMLTALGYSVRLDTLREFVAKGYVSDFGDSWDAVAVYALSAALEARRRWTPTPSPHDFKKTAMRVEIERLRAEGIDPPIYDIDTTSLEDLLIRITGCDHRGSREALYEIILVKLEAVGFIEE